MGLIKAFTGAAISYMNDLWEDYIYCDALDESTLMKKVAHKAEEMGYETELIYFSSDPESLDGVIVKDLNISVIDGTSPHTLEPKFPGAVENIINTGDFMGTKCKPADTLGILETIVEGKAKFEQWGPFEDIEIMYDWSGKTADFTPDLNDASYVEALKNAMQNRVNAVKDFATKKEGYDKLPEEALAALQKLVDELN